MTYEERLLIPLTESDLSLYSKSGIQICNGYKRIVIGGRGPYIEFFKDHLIHEVLFIPEGQLWRLQSKYDYAYYIEWRTTLDYVKVYEQKRLVEYADYKIGMWYISPFDLRDENNEILIKEISRTKQ